MSDRDGDGRLADDPRAHDGHKTPALQLFRDGLDHGVTPHHASEARRNDRDRAGRTDRRRRGFVGWRSRRGADETIAAPGDVDHIPPAILAIAEASAQRPNMVTQIAALHPNVRPA